MARSLLNALDKFSSNVLPACPPLGVLWGYYGGTMGVLWGYYGDDPALNSAFSLQLADHTPMGCSAVFGLARTEPPGTRNAPQGAVDVSPTSTNLLATS